MKHPQICLIVFFLALLGMSVAPASARADEWDMKTFVTFSAPVEIPGMVLPAGTYVFRLLDPIAEQNVVQILSQDEQHVYTTILAVPDYRLQPADKTVISFEERATGAPQAIKAWFYPGNNFGEEFVYPKVRATELAQANQQHVPAMPEQMMAPPAKTATSPEVLAMKRAPVTAIQPSGQEVQLAEVHPAKTTQTAMAKELPKTASSLPLLGLTGTLSLVGAFTLRLCERRAG